MAGLAGRADVDVVGIVTIDLRRMIDDKRLKELSPPAQQSSCVRRTGAKLTGSGALG